MKKYFFSGLPDNNSKSVIGENDIFIFFVTFAFGLVIHGYRFFNSIFSHDSLLIYQNDDNWQISLGRFLQPVYLQIRGRACAPLLIGILALFFLTVSIALIVRLTEIESKLSIVLICGILVINPSFSMSAATYIDWLDIYMLCCLLNVFAVYLCKKYKWGIAVGIICIAASMALYQAYIQIAVAFIIILLVKDILTCKTFKRVFTDTIKFGIMMVTAAIIYYASYKLVLKYTGIVPTDAGNGMNNSFSVLKSLNIDIILSTYAATLSQFFLPGFARQGFHVISTFDIFINALLFVTAAIEGCFLIRKKRIKAINIVLLALIFLIMPFAINVSDFLSGCNGHILTIYSVYFVYVLVILILEIFCKEVKDKGILAKKLLIKIVAISLICLQFENMVYTNQLYLKKDFDYQTTISNITKLTDRMECEDGYIVGETPVLFVGDFASNDSLRAERPYFDRIDGVGANETYNMSITSSVNLKQYFENVLAYPVNYLDEEKSSEMCELEEVKEMPEFPSNGSVKFIDKVLVVKLS